MTKEAKIELKNKILKGLEESYSKMLEFKKQHNSEVVIMRGDKIIRLKPEQANKLK